MPESKALVLAGEKAERIMARKIVARTAFLRRDGVEGLCRLNPLLSQPSHGASSLHSLNERLQPQMGESLVRCLLVVRLLQFLPDSQIIARDARNGSRDCGPRVGSGGTTLLDPT